MSTFVRTWADKIKGVITGFDRIVFKGCIRPLMYEDGARSFFYSRGVLNKNYKSWVTERSTALVESADAYARSVCDRGITPIPSCNERKDKRVEKQRRELNIKKGLIGVWSCVESGMTYQARYDAQAGFPQLRRHYGRCQHLYFYYDHADYGLMSVRLQTWFPYSIQLALNGREWLRRSLEREEIPFQLHENKFLHIADMERAQRLLDRQTDVRWVWRLEPFVSRVFPTMEQTLGPGLSSYYWTLWQSEWATDYLFRSADHLKPIMDTLLRHSLMTGTSDRILRYMGRPVSADGQPHPRAKPDVATRVNRWDDGVRIRHWVDHNSVKLYNEHNVLRAETTINNPAMFRVYRHAEGQKRSAVKKRMSLRKGIADIPLRTQVSADVNHRFMEHMATLQNQTPLRDVLKDVTVPFVHAGRPVRALDITGKDRELLLALGDPQYVVCGITNKRLQQRLHASPWAKYRNDKQLSARISRHLRLLRHHGLIRKMARQQKYFLTEKGRILTTSLAAMLAASTQQLMEKAA